MRPMIVPFLLVAVLPQMQKTPLLQLTMLSVVTPRPRVDVGTAFKLSGVIGGVTWEFGDETSTQAGGSAISHVYRSSGTFTVKAVSGGHTYQQNVIVVEPRRVIIKPTSALPGKPVVLQLSEPLGTTVQWTLGDGVAPINGGATITHTFAKVGSYSVSAKETGVEPARVFSMDVPVGLVGPGAPFSISYLALRWEGGATERSAKQGESGLVAFADLKYEGTGQLQAEWIVDGQVQRAVSQQLGFAKLTTLRTGQALATPLSTEVRAAGRDGRHTLTSVVPGEFQVNLPTNVAGEHQVTLKVLQPKLAFQVPVIRYFVKLTGEAQGPVVQSVSPANARPGDEVELILTGSGFTADMALNLGKDVGVLGVPQILSPEKAVVKVFIAPTAVPGKRLFQARKLGGSPAGVAQLEIVPAAKLAGALSTKPGATLATIPPGASTPPPTQPMSGSLPGGKPLALGTGLSADAKPGKALAQFAPADKNKKPLGLVPLAALRAPAVDLVKIPKATPGFSRIAGLSGGKGLAHIVDEKSKARKETVLACTEGQKLHLSKITLATPSFSLIGVNTSGEFQSDNLPVLRDSTQFTWKEKNPGTSEYFELRFYNAKNGSPIKTVRVPGNRSSYDVTPAFVQEIGQLCLQQNVQKFGALAGESSIAKVVGARSGAMKSTSGAPPKATDTGKPTPVSQPSGATKAKTGPGMIGAPATLGNVPMVAPDPDIPPQMRQKANVVWQVVGFRSYPCLSPEDLAAQIKTPALHLTPDEKPLPLLNTGLNLSPATPPSPSPKPSTLNVLSPKPRAEKSLNTKPGGLAPAPSKPGALSATGTPPNLDKPIAAQAQLPNTAAELPKVYQTVAAEVSRSEVWPLKMPVTPQGMNAETCTISMNDGKVTLEPNKKAEQTPKPGPGGGTSTYLDSVTRTNDQVRLFGTFDLGQKVPYRLIPASFNAPTMGSLAHALGSSGSTFGGSVGAAIGSSGSTIGGAVGAAIGSTSASSGGGAIGNAVSSSSSSTSGNSQNATNFSTANLITFKNVFVDWGDGTLEPFRGKPVETLYTNGNDFGSTYIVDAGAFTHVYPRASTYRVKVFVLSDEDMVREGIVGDVANGLTPTQSFQGVFARLSSSKTSSKADLAPSLGAAGTKPMRGQAGKDKPVAALAKMTAPAFGTHAGEFLDTRPSASQAMDRAYVVYCKELLVKNYDDPCSLLPLHLVSVHLEFPKSDPKEPQKIQVQGGIPQTAKAAQKAQLAPQGAATPKPHTTTAQMAGVATKPGLSSQTAASMGAQVVGAASGSAPSLMDHGPLPSTTSCNLFYSAQTRVKFYGHGLVRVVWKVDGLQIGSLDLPLNSPPRVGLKAEEAQTCKNPLLGDWPIPSPALRVDSLGRHIATVEAYVLPDKSGDLDLEDLTAIANLSVGNALSKPMSPRLAHTLASSTGGAGGAKPPVRLGLLNPSQTSGQPAYVALNQGGNLAALPSIQRAPSGALLGQRLLQPPYRVETQAEYEVKPTQGDKVCNLYFPTKGGTFPITNLGKSLTLTPDGPLQKASGEGILVFCLKAGTASNTIFPCPLSVSFSNWQVDGITVAKGKIAITPNQLYFGPGVKGTLKAVRGEIADKGNLQDMFATLSLSPTDTSLVLASNGNLQPTWNAEAAVTTKGDWIAKGLTMENTWLGPTPWIFSAKGVTIDLSSVEGVSPRDGKSPEWMGVDLGTVTVIPGTLVSAGGTWNKPLPNPTDWSIERLGVQGTVDVGPWALDYKSGHLAIANIHFKAKDGNYGAHYNGVEIRSPWFKDPIVGDASLVRMESGTYKLNLDKIHEAKRPTLAGGPMALEPLELQFTSITAGGLLMQGRARISLRTEDKPLATFDVDGVGFGLDGLLYFGSDGARSTKTTLNRASYLGPTPADLQDVILTGGNAKETPLNLKVNAKLRLSENPVIPGAPVTMNFSLKATGTPGAFSAPEVKVSPFSMDVAFPLGSPSMKAKINTNYQPGATAGGAPAMASNRFSGEVDLSMFGGTPVKAQFVLGYDKGKDYFATRVDVPVGPSGTPIIPEIIHLYRLSGGFAYNFGVDVFKDGGSIKDAKPDFKGETLFMAGARVGSGDGFIYTLDGQLVIRSSGAARMDYSAWLMARNPSGNAPLHGSLEYSGGNFDGRLWGGFSFLGDVVALELGASESTAACSLHFGGGNWRIYAGDRNGQRIVGKLMGSTVNGYLMLGNEVGLAVGGGSSWYMGAGVGVKAYAKGYMDMGLQITPQPKIIGDFDAGMEAGVCAFGACVTAGVSAGIHAEALPIAISASCCVDLPWPLGDICFTVKM